MTQRHNTAQKAYELLTLRVSQNQEFCKRYGSLAHRLPLMIRGAGLAQAIAYMEVRGNDEGKALVKDLANVLGMSSTEYFALTRTADAMQYMHLTQRSMRALLWFKRFAQTILNVEAGADDTRKGGAE